MDKESAARLGVPHPSEVTILPTTVGVNTADRNIVSHDHDNGLFTYVAKQESSNSQYGLGNGISSTLRGLLTHDK